MKQVCVIVGPTASGKTDLSIQIAKQYDGEIINGDAMQVYVGMDIGTAKITSDEMDNVPHHLFSFIDPSENYSIYQHQQNVRMWIEDITNRGKLPIIVGGSGLYIQSIVYDYQLSETTEEVQDFPSESNTVLWDKLEKLDKVSANQIHPNNRKRVIRALIRAQSGCKKSESEAKLENQKLLYDVFAIGISIERDVLHKRIEERVQQMITLGLEEEVRTLFSKDVGQTAQMAIGYREWIPYFKREATLREVQLQIEVHTRRLAKKQMTWFKNQRLPIHWINNDASKIQIIENITKWKKIQK